MKEKIQSAKLSLIAPVFPSKLKNCKKLAQTVVIN